MTESADLDTVPVATLVTRAEAEALVWHPLEPYEGVEYKLLWRSGKSVAGLMRLAPGGAVTPTRTSDRIITSG